MPLVLVRALEWFIGSTMLLKVDERQRLVMTARDVEMVCVETL